MLSGIVHPPNLQIYRQILAVEPNHADALHLLGVIAHQAGRHGIAAEYIRRAIGVNGNAAVFHINLGNVLTDQGNLDEAVACYRRALELKPEFAGPTTTWALPSRNKTSSTKRPPAAAGRWNSIRIMPRRITTWATC